MEWFLFEQYIKGKLKIFKDELQHKTYFAKQIMSNT